MPKMTKVAEVFDMEADTVIQAIKGTLKTLWKPKTGAGDDGNKWSFQNGAIADGADEIKVVFKDREEVPQSAKGKPITLMAFHGERGWSGVYANDNEYPKGSGKFTRELKVTKTAEVVIGVGSVSQPSDNNGDEPQQEAPPQRAQHPAPHDPRGLNPKSRTDGSVSPVEQAILNVKIFISRRASGMKICLKAAYGVREEYEAMTGSKMTDDQFQGITGSLFISGDRSGQFDALPVSIAYDTLLPKPKAKAKPAPAPEPEPEPEPEVNPDDVPM